MYQYHEVIDWLLDEQIRLRGTLACWWDVKEPSIDNGDYESNINSIKVNRLFPGVGQRIVP